MSVSFNIDEIFEMAEQIEKNASKFYHEAAKKSTNEATTRTFNQLADMEEGHYRIFEEMRAQLTPEETEQNAFDPDSEAVFYLRTMADSHGTEGKKSLNVKLEGRETVKEIFKIAIGAENNSIVFYAALKDLVSGPGGEKIEDIIREELGHLAILKQSLAEIA